MKQIATTWLLVPVLTFLCPPQLQAQPQTGLRPVPVLHFSTRKSPARSAGTQRAVRWIAAQKTPAPSIAELDRSSAPSAADLERRRVEKRQKYSELQERLQVLIREWQTDNNKSPQPTAVPSTVTEQSGAAETPEPSPTAAGQEKSLDTPPIPDPVVPATSVPEAATDDSVAANAANSPGGDSPRSTGLKLPDEVLVQGPVDRIALADNLYAMGEFSLAKEMYEQIDMKAQSVDQQFWVQFQNASCLREMGDLVKAKKQLRILAGQAEAEWLATSARWWLDMIDDRAELEQQIVATQSQLNSRRKVVDASNTK